MGVVLSSQVYSTTFTASTRTQLVDAISDAMVQGGWSRTGNSGDWYLTNGGHPNNYSATIRVWDPGSGNYARVGISSPVDLTGHSNDINAAAGGTWFIDTGPNHMLIINLSTFDASDGRKVYVVLPYCPSSYHQLSPVYTSLALVAGDRRTNGSSATSAFLSLRTIGVGSSVALPAYSSTSTDAFGYTFAFTEGHADPHLWSKNVIHCEPPLIIGIDNVGTRWFLGYPWDFFVAHTAAPTLNSRWTYDGNEYACVGRNSNLQRYFIRVS